MKAVVQDRYGGPEHLRLADILVPEPRPSSDCPSILMGEQSEITRSSMRPLASRLYARDAPLLP